MLRKTTAAVVLAGALALGTASATSLGSFDPVTFAASDVDLVACQVTSTALDLVPDLDADITVLNSLTNPIETFPLDAITVDIPTSCVGNVADVVLIDDAGNILETLSGVTTETGITLDTLANGLHSISDIADIADVRIVVSDA